MGEKKKKVNPKLNTLMCICIFENSSIYDVLLMEVTYFLTFYDFFIFFYLFNARFTGYDCIFICTEIHQTEWKFRKSSVDCDRFKMNKI